MNKEDRGPVNLKYFIKRDGGFNSVDENLSYAPSNIFRFNRGNLGLLPFFIRNIRDQHRAFKKRKVNLRNGINVPGVLALSITDKCNLNCMGCYLKSQQKQEKKVLSDQEIKDILGEAEQLGVGGVLLLGGEPLVKDVFELTKDHKHMAYAVYTNATLIDDAMVNKFRKNRHLVPLISMEGAETDNRRGMGMLDTILHTVENLHKRNVLFGISLTVTRTNFDEVCSDEFVWKMKKTGCRLFSYFPYVPIDPSTQDLALTDEQNLRFEKFIFPFRENYRAPILSPPLEKRSGGCVGAGKGIIHISYDGSVEPCPFAPFSDISIKDSSLAEVLNSGLFRNLRNHHKAMVQSNLSMCTLWKDEKWHNAAKTNDFSFLEASS